jgi:isopenicillin-N epimerase
MRSPFADRFVLDPSLVFLNHGSFGACPKRVLDAQTEIRARMEADPIGFFERELPERLDAARIAVAKIVSADPEGFAFVRNASSGVNAVLQSFPLAKGDAVLTTDHAYPACRNALAHWAERAGAELVVAKVPFPLTHEDEVVDAITRATTPRVKLALIDHVTSPTGLVLPIERIVSALEERGVAVLVDGAHAPGMVPLAIDRMAPSFYTGNFHKWLCAPKGAAMLWVRADRRAGLHPTSISHGYTSQECSPSRSRFHEEFDWTGTDDPSAPLCVPFAAEVMAEMSGSLGKLAEENRALALTARRLLAEGLGVPLPAPDSMIGSLASIPIPPRTDEGTGRDPLYLALFEQRIRVPIFPWPGPRDRVLRVSAQRHNDLSQYETLLAAVLRYSASARA